MLTSQALREKYLAFFNERGHAVIPSAPLVPENDPSVLFNTAGMQPLVPYLLGKPHPMGRRITDVQKCVRTVDIDAVGDDTHLTFFEMLGNWSLGDYFKPEAIRWSWEFLTSKAWLGLDPNMLSVTVFEGDVNAPRDEVSAGIWRSLGVPVERIAYLPAEDNWWAAGPTGPCGPDTEIFYWVGVGDPTGHKGTHPEQWMEIWNNVFMEYNRINETMLEKLPAPCVDTGMGLERTIVTLNGFRHVYETDAFQDVLKFIRQTVGTHQYQERSGRIIADHLRAATHLIADGVVPKNVDQGYVLRRLIRRAIREFSKMGYVAPIIAEVAKYYIDKFYTVYASVANRSAVILDELTREETKFRHTLAKGLKEFEHRSQAGALSGKDAFELFSTYGFPLEMTRELAEEQGMSIDMMVFQTEFKRHQELSRTTAAGKFKGGLSGDSPKVTALHTATHLMLAALRKELGSHVHQAGSNITEERTRFDFTHPEKVSREILDRVETAVNRAMRVGAAVSITVMDKATAKAQGVEGSFWEKYPDKVNVYTVTGPDGIVYSRELCGGPHVTNTQAMTLFGRFRIIKEEASSAGVRRIKGVFTPESFES